MGWGVPPFTSTVQHWPGEVKDQRRKARGVCSGRDDGATEEQRGKERDNRELTEEGQRGLFTEVFEE